MRVTFLSASLDLAGGSRVIATHAKMLAARGHDVTVVAPSRSAVPWRKRLRELMLYGRRGNHSHFVDLGRVTVRRIDRRPILAADVPDADVVIATWWETAEWMNTFGPEKGAKVYFVQGHEVFADQPLERVRATYLAPHSKIVVSGWLQKIMAEDYGDMESVLVPNAIDHSVFYGDPQRCKQEVPTLGFMYAHSMVKAPEVAIEAIRRVRARLPNLRVVAFGVEDPKNLGDLESCVEFTRKPTGEQIRKAYSSCDLWLCSSRSEGFGLPALEAMACATPVVSTRIGWPMDSVEDGVNGCLVPIDDVEALAQAALVCLSLAPQEWASMSRAASETARRYEWKTSSEKFEAALKSAVSRGGRR